MFRISESRNNKLVFLLQPRNYTQVYNALKSHPQAGQLVSLFARPDAVGEFTQWSAKLPGDVKPTAIREVASLSVEERDNFADALEDQQEVVAKILSGHKEFGPLTSQLMTVPNESAIKVIQLENKLIPVLTQWGCRSNEITNDTDPVTTLINIPRLTTAKVLVELVYTDGAPASSKDFFISYLGAEYQETSDEQGFYNRGRCRLDSGFSIFDMVNDAKAYEQHFTVVPDGKYVVIFPYIVPVTIKVADQKGRMVSGANVMVTYKGAATSYTSDTNGKIIIDELESDQIISVQEAGVDETKCDFTIEKEGNEFVLLVTRPVLTTATVKVIDDTAELRPYFPLLISYNGIQREYHTSESGIVQLENLQAGKEIIITGKNKTDDIIRAILEEEDNEFTLRVVKVELKFVTVKLLSRKRKPMPGVPIDFIYKGNTQRQVTDQNGICRLPYEDFVDNQKIKTIIHLPKKNKNNQQ